MKCQNCGSENVPNTRFCTGCGARLEEAAPPPPVYQQPPQANYQQPSYQSVPAVNPNTMPLRTSEFFWMILVLSIPLVGFICSLVWAFGSNANENRRTYCRAYLLWMVVGIVLSIVMAIILAALGASLGDFLYYL